MQLITGLNGFWKGLTFGDDMEFLICFPHVRFLELKQVTSCQITHPVLKLRTHLLILFTAPGIFFQVVLIIYFWLFLFSIPEIANTKETE